MTPTLVLLALAVVGFGVAAQQYYASRQAPQLAESLGLASLALALGAFVTLTPPPEPGPTPPPTGADFGGFRPHFQGFGAGTRGGRGGEVRIVDSLAPQKLLDAVAPRPGCVNTWETCARQVVFSVSGTIEGSGQLAITSPFLSIFGATAPAGGITLAGARFLIDTHEVYVGHIRVRKPPMSLNAFSVGDAGDGGDNSHVQNVILDHVTVSWATNVNNYLQAGPGSSNVLVRNSLIYEGLWEPPWGGIGAGIGGDGTFIENVVAHHWSRQPVFGSLSRLIIANNVIFNGTSNAHNDDALPAFIGDLDGDGNAAGLTEAMILWNVLVKGPDSGDANVMIGFSKKPGSIDAGSKHFLEGNTGPGVTGPDGDGQWVATRCGNYGVNYVSAATCGPGSNLRTNTPFAWWNDFHMGTLTGAGVRDTVLVNAGARPKDRDAADLRIIDQIRTGTGTHYLDWAYIQTHYGGMPVIPSVTRPVTLPSDPNGAGNCGKYLDGASRSRLDCFLEHDPTFGAQRLEVRP